MSRKFQVGDRVRILISDEMPEYVGEETTITEVMGHPLNRDRRFPNDLWYCTDLTFDDGDHACYPASALEPIYDGHERTSWSDCVWQPKALERAS